jgi:hypothetical protein
MSDGNEIDALKAAMRGARQTAGALAEIADRVDALDPQTEVPDAALDDLQRIAAAHALAAEALRGLVRTMLARRGKVVDVVTTQTVGEDE